MLLLICLCILLLLTVPVIVALAERYRGAHAPLQLEFWSFARSVGAKCHMPIGRARTPLIVKTSLDGTFRLSAHQSLFNRWSIQVRVYLNFDFGFAGRLCTPAAEALKWRTPGMAGVALFHDDDEYLADYSIESSSESLVRWVLRHPEVRKQLEHLLANTGGESLEFVMANQMLAVKLSCPRGWSAGDSIEHAGSALFSSLQVICEHVRELHEAIRTEPELGPQGCGVCAQHLGRDPYRCKTCNVLVHRGCREMVGSCHVSGCEECADFMPALNHPVDEGVPERAA
jgi:hypothetical protein